MSFPSFSIYIERILKDVNPNLGSTSDSKTILNNFINVMIDKLITIVNVYLQNVKLKTMSIDHITTAIFLILPNELAMTINEIARISVDKYRSSLETKNEMTPTTLVGDVIDELKPKVKKTSVIERSGLIMSVARVSKVVKMICIRNRIGIMSLIYLTSVIEYLIKLIIKVGSIEAQREKKHRMNSKHISFAIQSDPALKILCSNIIYGGGEISNVLRNERSFENVEIQLEDFPTNHISHVSIKKLCYRSGIKRCGTKAINQIIFEIQRYMEELLRRCVIITRNDRRHTIFTKDIKIALYTYGQYILCDFDTSKFKTQNGTSFKKCPVRVSRKIIKTHKFSSGIIANRNIKFYQKHSNCLFIAHASFHTLVNQIVNKDAEKQDVIGGASPSVIRFKSISLDMLQLILEKWLVGILIKANEISKICNRETLQYSDIKLAVKFSNSSF